MGCTCIKFRQGENLTDSAVHITLCFVLCRNKKFTKLMLCSLLYFINFFKSLKKTPVVEKRYFLKKKIVFLAFFKYIHWKKKRERKWEKFFLTWGKLIKQGYCKKTKNEQQPLSEDLSFKFSHLSHCDDLVFFNVFCLLVNI